MYQSLNGIDKTHKHRFIHCDLKPQNILVNREGHVKICVWGIARQFGIPVKSSNKEIVTLQYRAPDLLLGSKNLDSSVDMWSIGCIFAEMFIASPLFLGQDIESQLEQIFKIKGTPTEEEWPGFKEMRGYRKSFEEYPKTDLSNHIPGIDADGLDLLEKMLHYDPEKRISAKNAMKHPYLRRNVPNEIRFMK